MIRTVNGSAQDSPPAYSLAFETSGLWGSVALGDEGAWIEERTLSGPRRHAVELVACTAALCRDHDVSPRRIRCIYVSIGPGSFTGLRLGVVAARALAMTTGCRVVPVPSLDVIAHNALALDPKPTELAVLIDAKRGNVYASAFELSAGRYRAVSDPAEVEPGEFLSTRNPACRVMGNATETYAPIVRSAGLLPVPAELATPRAAAVFEIGRRLEDMGRFTHYRDLVPSYIRPPEAWERRQSRLEAGS